MKSIFSRVFSLGIIVLLGATVSNAELSPDQRDKHYNLKKDIALKGFDPVSYFSGTPQKGDQKFSSTVNGVVYHFASKENLEKFNQDHSQYEPKYGGWCAFAMLTGDKADIDPKTFKIVDGELLVFYNSFLANTLKKWDERAKSESDEKLIEIADREWTGLTGSS